MSKIEEVLYQAYYEGIKGEVLVESLRLSKLSKYKNMEVGDRLGIAYEKVVAKKQLK